MSSHPIYKSLCSEFEKESLFSMCLLGKKEYFLKLPLSPLLTELCPLL